MTVRSLALAALAATLTLAAASAQNVTGAPARMHVPFAFEAGSTHFAPGTYQLRLVNEHTLQITDGTHSALLMTILDGGRTTPTAGKVVFHRYGTQYFVESVYRPGMNGYLACVPTRAQTLAAKIPTVQVAGSDGQAQPAEIAILSQAN